MGVCGVLAVAAFLILTLAARSVVGAAPAPFLGTTASPQVRTVIQLDAPELHPRQLAYDHGRNGIWFWTSRQDQGISFENRIYFYAIAQQRLQSWPLPSSDWSSQVLAGLGVAPNGEIWIGWNHHLVDFHPADGASTTYELSAQPRFPLPASVLGDLPADLGIADLAITPDGTVWIARYAARALTAFSPASQSFQEYPLPANAGDPAKLAVGPDGHLFFTLNLSADHPGYGAEKLGEFDPQTGVAQMSAHGALALTLTPHGDLYTALGGRGFGLARLTASERANAHAQQRAPVFAQRVVPFDVDDAALTADLHGRVWLAMAGQPRIAALDPASGQIQQYQYAAPSVAANPPHHHLGDPVVTPAPGAVWVSHIVAMTADGDGHLWYVRAGYNRIEEVAA